MLRSEKENLDINHMPFLFDLTPVIVRQGALLKCWWLQYTARDPFAIQMNIDQDVIFGLLRNLVLNCKVGS